MVNIAIFLKSLYCYIKIFILANGGRTGHSLNLLQLPHNNYKLAWFFNLCETVAASMDLLVRTKHKPVLPKLL